MISFFTAAISSSRGIPLVSVPSGHSIVITNPTEGQVFTAGGNILIECDITYIEPAPTPSVTSVDETGFNYNAT